MNIQKRLQIEFEFLGDEQISGNTALNIVNQIFEEAETEQLALCSVVGRSEQLPCGLVGCNKRAVNNTSACEEHQRFCE